MIDREVPQRQKIFQSIKGITSDSISFGVKNKAVFIFFIISILVSFSNSSGNTFQQPRLVGLAGTGIWIMGWIKAIYSLLMMFGSWLIGYLGRKGKDQYSLITYSCFIIGFWLVLCGIFNSFYIVLFSFFIYEIGRGMYNPSKQSYLNNQIPLDKRATVLSFESMVSQIGMVAGLLITGIISASFTSVESNQNVIRLSWVLCGVVALGASLVPFKLRNINNNNQLSTEYSEPQVKDSFKL